MKYGSKARSEDGMVREETAGYGESAIVLYRAADGMVSLDVRLERETVWLTQKQMAALFATERSVITKHLRNVLKEGELDREAVSAKFAHTAEDGKVYQTSFYNLDAIISVGYRVNSKRGTQFRIWATGVLREQMAGAEKARAAAEAELNTISALPAALLRRAFNGAL